MVDESRLDHPIRKTGSELNEKLDIQIYNDNARGSYADPRLNI